MSLVLLADDSPHAQRMGERILREEGFEVVTALDGESAWRIFTGSIPREEAKRRATASGLPALTEPFFRVVAIMK